MKELLPIQKLTKEEKKVEKLKKWDTKNIDHLSYIAKMWVNQDRDYKAFLKTCEEYSTVALNHTFNTRFYYKSGIREELPGMASLKRKEFNEVMEFIFFEFVPNVISEYEFKRDYRKLRGEILLATLEGLSQLHSCTEKALINRALTIMKYNHELPTQAKKQRGKVANAIKGYIAKGYITFNLQASEQHKKEIYILDHRVEKMDTEWYFREDMKNE